MKEHPILFSGPMVQAILEGRKTQTRRVIKPQPIQSSPDRPIWTYDGEVFIGDEHMKDFLFHEVYGNKGTPYGSVYGDGTADVLWVRETWQGQELDRRWWHEIKEHRELYNWTWTNPIQPAFDTVPPRWLPSIHMPRMACRIFLEIVNVRVERVQEISTEDIRAEGISQSADGEGYWLAPLDGVPDFPWNHAHMAFASLWDSINGSRGPKYDPSAFSWERNPWVWVIEFKPCTPPEMRVTK